MSSAFVCTPVLPSSSFISSTSSSSRPNTVPTYNVAIPTTKFRTCVKMDLKSEQEQLPKKAAPTKSMKENGRGWTDSAERLNGRAAMMGFVLGLATEIIAPNHPTIVEQVAAVFKPLSNLF